MMARLHALLLRHWLIASCALGVPGSLGAQTGETVAAPRVAIAEKVPTSVASDVPVSLDRREVTARADDPSYDGAGMGSYEYQLRDTPFSNDLISADTVEDDPAAMEIAAELGI